MGGGYKLYPPFLLEVPMTAKIINGRALADEMQLAMQEETVKVTLRLSQSSIDFFKQQAKKYHTKYQKMLRFLVDKYVERYS